HKDWSIKYLVDCKYRYLKFLKYFEKLNINGKKAVDIGSFPYHFLYILKKLGLETTGLDLEPDRGNELVVNNNIKLLKCNIEKEKLPFNDNEIDMVFFTDVFEHLTINPIFAIREINRILKPGSSLFLTTPNLYGLNNIIHYMLGKGINDSYDEIIQVETIGHMGHLRMYSMHEVCNILTKENFDISYKKYLYFKLTHPNKYREFISMILRTRYQLIPIFRPYFLVYATKRLQ
ncbi:class I SAM-dependent methyltransferase, partial [candidate division KSB1 bacterium]